MTKDDTVIQTLKKIRKDLDENALKKMHEDLAGKQDPRRCESVTYRIKNVKVNGKKINKGFDPILIGEDTFLAK